MSRSPLSVPTTQRRHRGALARLAASCLCAAVLLGACSQPRAPSWSGYVEGDYVYMAASLGGLLTQLPVRSGDSVAAGAPLFALDIDSERAARLEAQARQTRAQALVSNLSKGRRHDELAVLRAQLTQAQTLAQQAANDVAREEQLVQQGFSAAARAEGVRTALAQARAHVAELQAQLRVAELPARSDERAAALADTEAATQAVQQLLWREHQKARSAPQAALVADTFFRPGEWVAPGQPVLSLLPPGNIKLRFFVPQADLAQFPLGTPVLAHCDGCAKAVAAKVSFVASHAEYTPPVIYSNAQRAKLVFMLEAKPQAQDALALRPGQPVDIRLATAGTP